MGERIESLIKSSADFDQVLRDILRKSPSPRLGVKDLAGEVGVDGRDGRVSIVILGRPMERSRTDLKPKIRIVLGRRNDNEIRYRRNGTPKSNTPRDRTREFQTTDT